MLHNNTILYNIIQHYYDYLLPTYPVIKIIALAKLWDCYTALMLAKRAKSRYPKYKGDKFDIKKLISAGVDVGEMYVV